MCIENLYRKMYNFILKSNNILKCLNLLNLVNWVVHQ